MVGDRLGRSDFRQVSLRAERRRLGILLNMFRHLMIMIGFWPSLLPKISGPSQATADRQ